MTELRRPGRVRITEKAVTQVVTAAAASVPGTVGVDRGRDRVTGRTYPRYDVQLDDEGQTASIEAFIAVSWPSPVTDVAVAVRETIIDWVRAMTGITAVRVNVVVGSVISNNERITKSLIDNRAMIPRLRRLTVRKVEPFIPVMTQPETPLRDIHVNAHPIRSITPPELRPLRPIELKEGPWTQ